MRKNDVIELTIDSYGDGGEGVGRFEGLAVFVPYTIIGERVSAKLILVKKNFAVGKLERIIIPSENRVTPKCPVFGKCGGCQLQHMNETAQKEFKTKKVADALKRIGKIDANVDDVFVGKNLWRYRNKLQLPLSEDNGRLYGGFYAAFSHRIVEINDCPIQSENSIKVFNAVMEYAKKCKVTGYNEISGTGLLRHLVVRDGEEGMLITLVINGNTLKSSEALICELDKIGVKYGLYLNINTEKTNVICSDKYVYLHGLKELSFTECGIRYRVLPQSFLQVNGEIKDEIYDRAVSSAKLSNKDTVINAYSGAGLLTARFSKACKQAYGVEIVKEATVSADTLAKENDIPNMINITGDCAAVIPDLVKKVAKENADGKVVVVLDPPRKGADLTVINAISSAQPDEIIYISCNPATLARDLKVLLTPLDQSPISPDASPYSIISVTPFDMFPETSHVETVVLMSRN